MEIEKQVCSLELAKKLKELGLPQESLFWWTEFRNEFHKEWSWVIADEPINHSHCEYRNQLSAYTVAELGEMLPFGFSSMKSGDLFKAKRWVYGEWEKESADQHARTEADARAMMLIHLYENGNLTDAA